MRSPRWSLVATLSVVSIFGSLLGCSSPTPPLPPPQITLVEISRVETGEATFQLSVAQLSEFWSGGFLGVCVSSSGPPVVGTSICARTSPRLNATLTVTGLNPGTEYQARGYLERGFVNAAPGQGRDSVFYGGTRSFRTQSLTPPSAITGSVSGVSATGAIVSASFPSDGNSPVTELGLCYGTAPAPSRSGSCVLADLRFRQFTASLTGLSPATTYFGRAFSTNGAGTVYGTEVNFTTLSVAQSCPPVTDIDGNTYASVAIGNACWTQTNLRVTRYRNGDPIVLDDSGGRTGNDGGTTWSARTIGARTTYANDASNAALYGQLYNAFAVLDPRGLCPTGWSVPTDEQWTVAIDQWGGSGVAGGAMKSMSGWLPPNVGATNQSGFTGLPGGFRGTQLFNGIGSDGYWWTSTRDIENDEIRFYLIFNDEARVLRSRAAPALGMSVRCVQAG
jgi:uncharacterized protein (TIGR02145 family)